MPLGFRLLLCTAALAVAGAGAAPAQSVSAEGGPLSESSRLMRGGSAPVHEGGSNVGAASAGSMISGPVRDAGTRSMRSGPVSEISRGPMYTASSTAPPGGAVHEASAGAVKLDAGSPVGTGISDPLHELHPLRERLRQMLGPVEPSPPR